MLTITGKSDPFCVFGIGPKLGTWTVGPFKTKTKKKTLNPVWEKSDKSSTPVGPKSLVEYKGEFLFIEVSLPLTFPDP